MQKKLEGVLIILVGLAICFMGVLTMMKPPLYRAVARIEILSEPEYTFPGAFTNSTPSIYDPYFIQTEYEALQSMAVLGKVVDELDLNRIWGNRYQGGVPFKRFETIALLRHRMDLKPVRNTKLVEIGVLDEDPAEAALIANTIVRAYNDHRHEQVRLWVNQGIEIVRGKLREQEHKTASLQATLGKLKTELHVPDSLSDAELKTNYPNYFVTKQQLDESERLRQKWRLEFAAVEDDPDTNWNLVEIVDIAKPPADPISRNWLKGLPGLIAGVGCVGFGLKRMV